MIRIHRGVEPAELAAARATELQRVQTIAATRRPVQEDLGRKYEIAHQALWNAQRYKCCYCESREQSKRNDVEHFRPKARADRRPGISVDHGYWWLTWTWENLLFSCRNCNQAPAKLDKFPLAEGSAVLLVGQHPPGQERPLLIDPATESGIEHIQFVRMPHGPTTTGKWYPRPRNGSRKGAVTIKVCMLDRPDLLDLYGDYVERNVKPRTDDIRTALQEGRIADARREWSRALLTLLNPRQEYVGLSHDALDHFIPTVVRKRHQLELRLP
ncbi:HNH endonuclease [Archangium violaceum]|uniref:HNH nuclease domain-containing protein n=1 Tax=Archangium violaceum Cb vi76 TaxID=1406225 RepID=A0A084SRF5_9BACT|nr:HNH endonuclease [Archangium violaceum]KFA91040.1 hypothetical protein Q664_24630 [Archangium violaceum Cb vi76]